MAHTVATPISRYDLKETPYGLHLGGMNKGCLIIFGIFFMLPGIFIVGAMLQLIPVSKIPDPYSGEWWAMTALGLAFLGFGSVMASYKSHIEIDTRKREVRIMKGLLVPSMVDRFDLNVAEKLLVTRQIIPDSDGPDQVVFPVILTAHNGHNLALGHYISLHNSIKAAITISGKTGLKAYDATVDAQREITSADITSAPILSTDEASKFETRGVRFTWDGHTESLSRLSTARHNGINFYKTEYPKMLIMRIIVMCFGVGFYLAFFGWRVDKTLLSLYEGFTDPNFFTSVEILFTTVIASAFVLFLLLGPAFGLLLNALRPPHYSLIGIGSNALYLHAPTTPTMRGNSPATKSHHLLIRYQDIKGLDIKVKTKREGQKIRKFEKSTNFIALRVGTDFYELGCGLDREQLIKIADEIKGRMGA